MKNAILTILAICATITVRADYEFSTITNAATGAKITTKIIPDGSDVVTIKELESQISELDISGWNSVSPGYGILSLTTNITEKSESGGMSYITNIAAKVHYVKGGWNWKMPPMFEELADAVGMTNTTLEVGSCGVLTNLDFNVDYTYAYDIFVREGQEDMICSFQVILSDEFPSLTETNGNYIVGRTVVYYDALLTYNNGKQNLSTYSACHEIYDDTNLSSFTIEDAQAYGVRLWDIDTLTEDGGTPGTISSSQWFAAYEKEDGIHFIDRLIQNDGEPSDLELFTAASTNQLFSAISTLEEQIDTESPLLARSYAIEQQEGWTYDRANGSTIYLRPRYFGMNDGDLFKGIIVRTKDVNLTPFTSVYMRLKRYTDGAILGVSDAVVYPNTPNTDVVFSFPQAITLPSKDNYYSIDFSETPGGESISQFGMRIYVLSSGTNPDCYFQISSIVPVMTVQFYSFAEVVAPTADATTGQLADAKDTYDALTRKADKPATFTAGNLAGFDENGNPMDSGVKPSDKFDSTSAAPAFDPTQLYNFGDFVTKDGILYQCEDASAGPGLWSPESWGTRTVLGITAQKAPNPTDGHIAALDASGNPTDSGIAKTAVAPLASPSLTGTPTAPDIGTNTTSQIATKNYVDSKMSLSVATFGDHLTSPYLETDTTYTYRTTTNTINNVETEVVTTNTYVTSTVSCVNLAYNNVTQDGETGFVFLIPEGVSGYARKFYISLECGSTIPSIKFKNSDGSTATLVFKDKDPTTLVPVEGCNLYTIREITGGKFLVERMTYGEYSP